MVNAVLKSYIVSDAVLLVTGILLVGAGAIWHNQTTSPPVKESVGRILLLERCPLAAVIANGVLVVVAFFISLPAFALPTSRSWLKFHIGLVVICLVFTLCLGLNEWMQTLSTRANLEEMWGKQTPDMQSMLQQKFDCCGYLNWTYPPYVSDSVCTSDIVASTKEGCVTPFSRYAERWLNVLFTAAFGIVGLDVVVLLCAAMLINYRKEQHRYHLIDRKWGVGST